MKSLTHHSLEVTPERFDERRRGLALGAIARTIGLGCCVYPVALVLAGAASASTAVALGYDLYENWGWAFKGAGAAFAVAAIAVQRRVGARPNVAQVALWLGGSALTTYALLYGATAALGTLAS